jgi:hypothetical protein
MVWADATAIPDNSASAAVPINSLLLIGTVPSVIIPRGAEVLGYEDNNEIAAQFRAARIARRFCVVID